MFERPMLRYYFQECRCLIFRTARDFRIGDRVGINLMQLAVESNKAARATKSAAN